LVQRLTLRSGFATHLSYDGVAPRTAQAAMRHSSRDLTMLARRGENVYTDPSSALRQAQGYGGQAPACSTWSAQSRRYQNCCWKARSSRP